MDTKKVIRTVLLVVPTVTALLFLMAFFVARSQAFRQFLLAKIIQETEASTGSRVEIKNMTLRWSPFTAELFGIVLYGQEQNAEAPLFLADHLRVGLSIKSLLQHKVDLSEIALDNPVVHLRVDTQGHSNLPRAPTRSSSPTSFTLLIRHLVIRSGLIHYNDEQIPLSAELQDFGALAGFDTSASTYKGSLWYRQGWIRTTGINPFEHNAHIDFEANRHGLAVDPMVLSSGRSRVVTSAKITDFANPSVEGKYDGVVLLGELAHVAKSSAVLSGEVALSGTMTYRNLPDQPSLNGASVKGRLDSQALGLRINQISSKVKSIHAWYQLQSGDFRVSKLDADLLDGHLTASAEMLHLNRNPSSHLSVALRGISLEKVSDAVPAAARQNVRLIGHADVQAQAAWANDIRRLTAHSHAEIYGPPPSNPRADGIPVDGLVDVSYDGANQSASLGQSHIRTGSTELLLRGVLGPHSNLDADVKVGDLHELAVLASTVMAAGRPSTASRGADSYDVHGSAGFTGQVSGPMTDPRIKGQLYGNGLQVQESKWRTVRAGIDVSSSGAAFQNGYLESEQQGQLSFDGSAGLQHWSLPPTNPVSMHVKMTKLSINELERLGKLAYPVAGDLSGELWIEGSQQNPTGRGSLQLVRASAWGEPVKALKLDFRGDRESLESTGQLQMPAGSVDAHLTYSPEAQRYDADVSTTSLDLGRVQALRDRAGPVSGSLTATARGKGTLKDPQLNAQVQIPELRISGQAFEKIQAQLNLGHQHADFSVDATVAEGHVQASGGIDLKDEYLSNATVDVRALPLGPLLGKYLPEQRQDLQGLLEIHGALKGPLKELARVEGHVEIPTFNLRYKDIQIANDRPLRMKYSNGTVTVEEARIKGTGSELSVQGTIPAKSTAPLNLSANGTVDLGLLPMVAPDAHASGQVHVDLKASGSSSRPTTQGQIRIVNTSLSAESLPVALSGINAEMTVSGNRVDLSELKGTAGGGTISSHGSFIYGPQPNFDLEFEAKSVRVHQTGIRSTLDGKVQLRGSPQKSLLTGKVLVDRLSFQEGFDLSTFLSQFSGEPTVSTPSSFQNNMQLNLSVQSTENLNLASSQLSIEGSADLHVTGTAGNPVILGRVALTGGEVFFLSKRFEIQSGTIAFANPVRTEPVVNLFVNTTVQQYKITMNFVGPLDRLKTNYTSDPSLPPLDIINLLAFGKTAAESASNTSTPPSLGAESALAQGVAGQVGKGVQNLTGVSQLTIDPMVGNTQNPGAQVSIQQRVTGSVLLTFSTDVTSTQSQTVQLQYQPKPQVTVSVLRDQFGGYGFDVRLHKVF
jgi:translocation and assembly module TamB